MKSDPSPAILSVSVANLLRRPFPSFQRVTRWVGAAALAAFVGSTANLAMAVDYTWNGSVDNNWATAGNWTPPGVPGTVLGTDNLFFAGSNNTNTNNNVPLPIFNSVNFNSGAARFLLGGAAINLDAGGITNNSVNLQVISFVDTFGAPGITLTNFNGTTQVWNAAAGDMLITSNIGFGAALTLVITGSHNITITGVISDLGVPPNMSSLVKNGTGTLRLTAMNTYPGDTIVNGGTLLVDGGIQSLKTVVNAGGTLGGIGIIGGNVFNGGNVAPGDSPGTLTIKKNYYQTGGGTLTIEIASKKKHDLLAVGGQANLDGTLRLVRLGKGPRLNYGDKITIVSAQGGVEGEFSKVDTKSFDNTLIKPKVIYHNTTVEVEGAQASIKDIADRGGFTFNQRATAAGLDKLAFRNQGTKLLRYIDSQPLPQLPNLLDRIAPEELASVFNVGVALATVQLTNTQRRTDDLRSGATGFSASGFHTAGAGPSYSGSFGVAGPTGNDGKDSKKSYIPPEENRFGAFITGVGEWVDVGDDGNARGYDITTGGFTLGLDYKFTPNLAIGISAGYAGTGVDLTNNGRVYVNGGKVGLYGTYFDGGLYVDAAVNGGGNSYDTKRASVQGTARGSTEGGELNTLIGVGYDFHVGALAIGPTFNFQYSYIGLGAFDETGSLAPLSIRSQSGESLRTALGFKAAYDWKVGGVLVKPELRAAWQHEYGDSSFDLESGFRNAADTGFTVRGPEIGRDSLLLGAGVAVLWNERTSTYVYYDGDIARTNYESHSVSGGMRLSF